MSDLKCARCDAPADFDIRTSVTGISPKAKDLLVGAPASASKLLCMGCVEEIGPGAWAAVESTPDGEPEGRLQ